MSAPETLGSLRRRYEEIGAALDRVERSPEPSERDRLRGEIVQLFRDTESLIEGLTEFREAIRPLIDRYRAIFPRGSAADSDAASVRVDHLGSSTFLERGWNAIAGADYERAAQELRRALERAPGAPRAECLLAWALMRLGRLAEARRLLERVLTREPENALALTNLGYVLFREGRYDESVEQLSRVCESSSDRTATQYAHLYLGMAHAEQASYSQAYACFERALEIGPNLIEAFWEMGRARYREGDAARAAETWRRGAEANRFNPWAERCERAAGQVEAGEALSLD